MSPFGFTPGGTGGDGSDDPDFNAMMRQMQEQIKAQFDKFGIGFPAGQGQGATNGEVLSAATIRDTAKKVVTTAGFSPLGTKDLTVVTSALEIAEIWLNEATSFPALGTNPLQSACSRTDWIDQTLPGWQAVMEPLAQGLTKAVSALIDEATNFDGGGGDQVPGSQMPMDAIAGMLRTFMSSLIATQLGQSIGSLATKVTGAHDVGLPLLDPSRPLLIPENVEEWAKDLEIPKTEVFLFHVLRESAVARLFAYNPWLTSYIKSAIVEYGRGVHIDLEAIQRQAEEAFENMTSDSFSLALDSGVFTPEETPTQKLALTKLETVLALIDGWADEVTTLAAGDRLPAMELLRETLRRRRAAASPAQQLFASLLGLEVSPKTTREASAFWQKIREVGDIQTRDAVWRGLLPTAENLLNPESFIASTAIPDDLSGLI